MNTRRLVLTVSLVICSALLVPIEAAEFIERIGPDLIAGEVLETEDGGFVVAAGNDHELSLIKLDRNGQIEFIRSYGPGSFISYFPVALVQTSGGGYAMASRNFGLAEHGPFFVWMVWLDSRGNLERERVYQTHSPVFESMTRTTDGGFILAGSYPPSLMKLDEGGDVVFATSFEESVLNTSGSAIETRDGGLVMVGGGVDSTNHPFAYFMKLDSQGDTEFTKSYRGLGQAGAVVELQDGGFMVAGNGRTIGTSGTDIWMARLDETGQVEFANFYTSEGYQGSGVGAPNLPFVQTADGGFLVGALSSYALSSTGLLLSLDSSGALRFAKSYGSGGSYDRLLGVADTSDGGSIAVGWVDGVNSAGGEAWVLKLDMWGEVPGCSIGVDAAVVAVAADVTVTSIDVAGIPTPSEAEETEVVVGEPPASVNVDCFHANRGDKICVCHFPPGNASNPKTVCVGVNAAEAHLAEHDDIPGRCRDFDDDGVPSGVLSIYSAEPESWRF